MKWVGACMCHDSDLSLLGHYEMCQQPHTCLFSEWGGAPNSWHAQLSSNTIYDDTVGSLRLCTCWSSGRWTICRKKLEHWNVQTIQLKIIDLWWSFWARLFKTPSKHPQQLPHIASPISGRCTAWATTAQKMACMVTVDPHGSLYSPFYNVCCGSPHR